MNHIFNFKKSASVLSLKCIHFFYLLYECNVNNRFVVNKQKTFQLNMSFV